VCGGWVRHQGWSQVGALPSQWTLPLCCEHLCFSFTRWSVVGYIGTLVIAPILTSFQLQDYWKFSQDMCLYYINLLSLWLFFLEICCTEYFCLYDPSPDLRLLIFAPERRKSELDTDGSPIGPWCPTSGWPILSWYRFCWEYSQLFVTSNLHIELQSQVKCLVMLSNMHG
jgi:hypothetical protein